MRNSANIIPFIDDSKKNIAKMMSSLERAQNHLFFESVGKAKLEAEDAYGDAVKVLHSITNVLGEAQRVIEGEIRAGTKPISPGENEHGSGGHFCTVEMVSDDILRCKTVTAPLLKKRFNVAQFKEYFGIELATRVATTLSEREEKPGSRFERATIVYVQHYDSRDGAIAPYYDNDNLAIKAYLDVIVPQICHDDAALFCDNIYCMQADTDSFAELFVINEGHLRDWARRFPGSSVAHEINAAAI